MTNRLLMAICTYRWIGSQNRISGQGILNLGVKLKAGRGERLKNK